MGINKIERAQNWINHLQPVEISKESERLPRSNKLSRIGIVFLLSFMVVAGLKLINIQISDGSRYRALANGNRLRERINYAPRGKILDRNGIVLADNIVSTKLIAYPYLIEKDKQKKEEVFLAIAEAINQNKDYLNRILDIENQTDIQPRLVSDGLRHEQIIRLEEILSSTNGFALEEVPSRKYVSDAGLSHILGYTGLVSSQDLKDDDSKSLIPTDTIGRSGVESTYDDFLRGVNGVEKIEVDSLGRPLTVLAKQPGKSGRDLRLTIDLNIQKKLEASLRKQMVETNTTKASGLVIEPSSGEVLAMVSLPYYDNNLFAQGISQDMYDQLLADKDQPMINRIIQSGYPTGSIIKTLVGAAALEEKVVSPSTVIVDRGYIEIPSMYDPSVQYRYVGWNPSGLGSLDIRKAISYSSNIYFYTVGGGFESVKGLGVDRLNIYYSMFGLGQKTGIKLPGEISGLVPNPQWKKSTKNEEWFVGDTYNISIGQGDMMVTPLQITMAQAAIANGGSLLVPSIAIDNKPYAERKINVNQDNLEIIKEGMRSVIEDGVTVPRNFERIKAEVAGKSGTAETNSPGGKPPHAWFTAFAPYKNPKILVTIMIEEAKEGGRYASPVAADIFEYYFSSRQP